MISNFGFICILSIVAIICGYAENNNIEKCYKRDPYICLKCKKKCKWHDVAKKYLEKGD